MHELRTLSHTYCTFTDICKLRVTNYFSEFQNWINIWAAAMVVWQIWNLQTINIHLCIQTRYWMHIFRFFPSDTLVLSFKSTRALQVGSARILRPHSCAWHDRTWKTNIPGSPVSLEIQRQQISILLIKICRIFSTGVTRNEHTSVRRV